MVVLLQSEYIVVPNVQRSGALSLKSAGAA
jgi:hypothetical protein